jgi:hypothetical protein
VRFIRIPIARTLRPVSTNLRSLSSSARVHGREAKFAGSDIGCAVSRTPSFTTLSMSWCIEHSPRGAAFARYLIRSAFSILRRLQPQLRKLSKLMIANVNSAEERVPFRRALRILEFTVEVGLLCWPHFVLWNHFAVRFGLAKGTGDLFASKPFSVNRKNTSSVGPCFSCSIQPLFSRLSISYRLGGRVRALTQPAPCKDRMNWRSW